MASRQKATDHELLEAYRKTGNVHKAGALLGMNGASVHERLVKLGANVPVNVMTDAERAVIRAYYEQTDDLSFDLKALAKRLKRSAPLVSRTAREMGLTDRTRPMAVAAHQRMVLGNQRRGQSRYPQPDRPEFPGIRFRSRWEANYARYLNWRMQQGEIKGWEYETETFWFLKIKRGVRSYTPDFKVFPLEGDPYFIELKGYMDDKSITKLKRMRIYHPNVRVELVPSADYKALAKTIKHIIPGWE